MGKIAQQDSLLQLLLSLGRPSKANPAATASIDVISSVIINANKKRQSLVITNVGSYPLFIGIGQSAVANNGIYLVNNGGCWEMNYNTFSTQKIFGIGIGGVTTVSIQEFE